MVKELLWAQSAPLGHSCKACTGRRKSLKGKQNCSLADRLEKRTDLQLWKKGMTEGRSFPDDHCPKAPRRRKGGTDSDSLLTQFMCINSPFFFVHGLARKGRDFVGANLRKRQVTTETEPLSAGGTRQGLLCHVWPQGSTSG